jgi:pimeloyl-ACP methyl ester carboxylesterase/DNA-binding CsgD family transcriptional regulator
MTLRQTIRFCTAHDGARIAYAETGHGAPLVKVGNWLTHLEVELASPVWGHLVEALSRGHLVLRYDQRGTGLSDWDVADISFEAMVRDLETVVDAAGIERFALLGISQGCPVGIAYAVRHPERVSHLILHGGYARGRRQRGGGAAALELADTMVKLAELGWGKDDSSFRQFFTNQFIPEASAEQQRWFNELERVSASPHNAARTIRTLYDIDVTALLPAIDCPTLVLHATHDLSVPFAEGRLLAGAIAQARFVPLDTPHHLMLADDPAWARWTEEVQQFLGMRSALAAGPRFDGLTPRERELLELIAQGRDNAQIAAVLALSDKTVRNHITSIFAKLEVENRPQAIVLARNAGFGAA